MESIKKERAKEAAEEVAEEVAKETRRKIIEEFVREAAIARENINFWDTICSPHRLDYMVCCFASGQNGIHTIEVAIENIQEIAELFGCGDFEANQNANENIDEDIDENIDVDEINDWLEPFLDELNKGAEEKGLEGNFYFGSNEYWGDFGIIYGEERISLEEKISLND